MWLKDQVRFPAQGGFHHCGTGIVASIWLLQCCGSIRDQEDESMKKDEAGIHDVDPPFDTCESYTTSNSSQAIQAKEVL